MPNFPQPPTNEDYATDPWTDANGQQWTYDVSKNRWHPYTPATGGVSTYAELTDKVTATIATTNTSVADALALLAPKASPTFTGTVTIPSGASISGYLTTATAASTYQPTLANYSTISGLTGYPSTFAPSSHTHAPSEVTGTAATLAGNNTFDGLCGFTDIATFDAGANFGLGVTFSGTVTFDGIAGFTDIPLFQAGATFSNAVTFDATSTFTYGTGAAAAHRTALGAGTTGASLFQAATTTAAWTAIGGTGTAASPSFTAIGATTPGTGAFTAITASGAIVTPAANSQETCRINIAGGNKSVCFGTYIGVAAYAGMWFGNITQSNSNYAILGDGGGTFVNATTQVDLRINNTAKFTITTTGASVTGTLAVTGDSTLKSWTVGSDITANVTGASLQISSSGRLRFGGGGTRLFTAAGGLLSLTTSSETVGINLDFATDGTLKIRDRSNTASTGNLDVGGTIAVTGVGTMGNFKRGTGSPESVVTGSVGDLYTRTDGGAGTTLYVKESGSATNTGWVAK